MAATITVRRVWRRPIFRGRGGAEYAAVNAWAVYVHGLRIPGIYVVETPHGRSIIRDGVMTQPWHAGIAPGDMARRYYPAPA